MEQYLELLKGLLSERRYLHSIEVCKEAERLALQSELDSMADITISMLESFGIPAFKVGTQGKVLLGFAGLGVEIYVPASRLEEAQMLLAAQGGDAE